MDNQADDFTLRILVMPPEPLPAPPPDPRLDDEAKTLQFRRSKGATRAAERRLRARRRATWARALLVRFGFYSPEELARAVSR